MDEAFALDQKSFRYLIGVLQMRRAFNIATIVNSRFLFTHVCRYTMPPFLNPADFFMDGKLLALTNWYI